MAEQPETAACNTPQESPPRVELSVAAASNSAASGSLWRSVVAPLLLVVLIAALYWPSTDNGFLFDDHVLILHQRPPASVLALAQVFAERHWPDLPYYRPVARVTMVAQKMLHGDNPTPFHVFNVIVMSLVAVAAYWLMLTPSLGVRPTVAWLGALLVGAHPIASSCVYPICSGRETLLPALFMLLATGAWMRLGGVWRAAALASLVAALLSKEQAIVTPAILLATDLLCVAARPAGADAVWWLRRYSPVVVLTVLYFAARLVLFGGGEEHEVVIFEKPILPLLTAMYAAQVTFLPFVPLLYEPLPEHWFSWWRQAVCLALVVALAVAVARAWPRVRSAALFWLMWIVLVNLPTANFLNQEASFDERYELLSLFGVVGLMGSLVSLAWTRAAVRWTTVAAATALLVLAATVSYGRAAAFHDDFTFFEAWRRTIPDAEFARLHLQVAGLETQIGRYAQAEAHARAVLALAPDAIEAQLALGEALLGERKLDAAQHEFEAVLRREWERPEAHDGLARIHLARGEWSEAATRFRTALRSRPIVSETARRYAWLLATCPVDEIRNGREAVRWATIVVEADRRDDVLALETLAAAYAEAGDFAQAVRRQEEALRHAASDEAGPLRRRLELYRAGRPFRDQTDVRF